VKVQPSAIAALATETVVEKLNKLERLYAGLIIYGNEDSALACRKQLQLIFEQIDRK
jgi:hypothetical protein